MLVCGLLITTSLHSQVEVKGSGNTSSTNTFITKNSDNDTSLLIRDDGNIGIGITTPGTYKVKSLLGSHAFANQLEIWTGDPAAGGSRMLGDIADVSTNNGSLNLYLNGTKQVQMRAGGLSYLNGGNVGMGITNPLEMLHLGGAIIVGLHTQPPGSEVAGTMAWNGSNFVGFDGIGWINLDTQAGNDNDWAVRGILSVQMNWCRRALLLARLYLWEGLVT